MRSGWLEKDHTQPAVPVCLVARGGAVKAETNRLRALEICVWLTLFRQGLRESSMVAPAVTHEPLSHRPLSSRERGEAASQKGESAEDKEPEQVQNSEEGLGGGSSEDPTQ